jgi:hypothetical protein
MNTCIYCGCELLDNDRFVLMHDRPHDCVAALKAANAELRRQLDELLKSVKYLREDVTK